MFWDKCAYTGFQFLARDLLTGECCSQEEATLFICGVWSLWSGRNARRHGVPIGTPWRRRNTLQQWSKTWYICLQSKIQVEQPRCKGVCSKPELGWKGKYRCFISNEIPLGFRGAVIRDEEGRLLMASSIRYKHILDVLTTDALATRDGLLLARAGGYEKVVLEFDNITLVNLYHSKAGDRSKIAGFGTRLEVLARFLAVLLFLLLTGKATRQLMCMQSCPRCHPGKIFGLNLSH